MHPPARLVRSLAVLLLACGGAEPAAPEAVVTGTLLAPLAPGGQVALPNTALRVVALGTNRSTKQATPDAAGNFALTLAKNASYSLNVLDTTSNTYIGSFLFRTGDRASVALNVQADEIPLRRCQFQNGEVWCENGFFDTPSGAAAITPVHDALGGLRFAIDGTGPGAALLRQLVGGDQVDYELVAHPDDPFRVALFNRTRSACAAPFLGVAEAVGAERYLYTQETIVEGGCRAAIRYQATCTMADGVCRGFLRVDITSSGTGCEAYPPSHVAEPFTVTVTAPGQAQCAPPPACASDLVCESGVCDIDAGFCRVAPREPTLKIYTFDVGNGTAQLIVSPSGRSLLIDGGRPAAGRMLTSLIRRLVSRLDYVMPSQYDADHAGAIPAIVLGPDGAPGRRGVNDDGAGRVDDDAEIGAAGSDDMVPAAAIDRGAAPGNATYEAYARVVGGRRRAAQVGETIDLGDPDLTVTVLAANGVVLGAPPFTPLAENDRCVGLLVRYGDFTYLTLADLPGTPGNRRMEQAAAAAIAEHTPIDVHQLSHHGSGVSSQPELLAALKPKVAIISVGDSESCGAGFNSYGLPAQATLNHLAQAGTVRRVYQTETGGASFTGPCAVEGHQTYPRDYGALERVTAYSTITVEATRDAFRVWGLTFDDRYDAR